MTEDFVIVAECPEDEGPIEEILDDAFGLLRRVKTSYRFREGEVPVEGLSFVVRRRDAGSGWSPPLGTIRFWRLRVGPSGSCALLLGPLAVHRSVRGRDLGHALMRDGLGRAAALGERLVLLVGDKPYYAALGFDVVPEGRFFFPGPVDPSRFLYRELVLGALEDFSGLALPPKRFCQERGLAYDEMER